jgi:hypothetical protein
MKHPTTSPVLLLRLTAGVALALPLILASCSSPSFTAVDLNKGSPSYGKNVGMPYYLPKTYLVVTKNVSYIQTPTTGLTTNPIPGTFDSSYGGTSSPNGNQTASGGGKATQNQANGGTSGSGGGGGTGGGGQKQQSSVAATAAKINGGASGGGDEASGTGTGGPAADQTSAQAPAATTQQPSVPQSQLVPGPSDNISDGLVPTTFYTYQIVFLPDPNQKYGLKVKGGGTGETRANINLVNGWMFTGTGPLYMRNSSNADTTTAILGGVGQITGTTLQDAISAIVPSGAAATGAAAVLKGVAATGATLTPQNSEANGGIYAVPPTLPQPTTISGYAEITVYAINVSSTGEMTFDQVFDKTFDRDVYALAPPPSAPQQQGQSQTQSGNPTDAQTAEATTYIQGAIAQNTTLATFIDSTKVRVTLQPTQLSINATPALDSGHKLTQDEYSSLLGFLTDIGNKCIAVKNLGSNVTLKPPIVPPVGSIGPSASTTAPPAQPGS